MVGSHQIFTDDNYGLKTLPAVASVFTTFPSFTPKWNYFLPIGLLISHLKLWLIPFVPLEMLSIPKSLIKLWTVVNANMATHFMKLPLISKKMYTLSPPLSSSKNHKTYHWLGTNMCLTHGQAFYICYAIVSFKDVMSPRNKIVSIEDTENKRDGLCHPDHRCNKWWNQGGGNLADSKSFSLSTALKTFFKCHMVLCYIFLILIAIIRLVRLCDKRIKSCQTFFVKYGIAEIYTFLYLLPQGRHFAPWKSISSWHHCTWGICLILFLKQVFLYSCIIFISPPG